MGDVRWLHEFRNSLTYRARNRVINHTQALQTNHGGTASSLLPYSTQKSSPVPGRSAEVTTVPLQIADEKVDTVLKDGRHLQNAPRINDPQVEGMIRLERALFEIDRILEVLKKDYPNAVAVKCLVASMKEARDAADLFHSC